MPQVLNRNSGSILIMSAVKIDRTTLWGNPFIIGIHGDRDTVCDAYLEWLNRWTEHVEEIKIEIGARVYSNRWVVENLHLLKGKDVVCYCAPLRCHGDILIRLANL